MHLNFYKRRTCSFIFLKIMNSKRKFYENLLFSSAKLRNTHKEGLFIGKK